MRTQSQSRRRRAWRNFKFYIVGFAVVVVASLISTGLEMLPGLFPDIHPLNQLATDLSGITLGGIIMVLGFMRDTRLEEARERTEAAEEETKVAQAAVKVAQEAIKAAQAEAERQRERAERAEAELARREYDAERSEILARLRRLEERYGIAGADGGSDG